MRQLSRRAALQLAAGSLAAFAMPALAQSYPTKPIKLILPYAAGGGPDVLTRVFADKMGELLGQRVVVDNRVGAGGMLAATVISLLMVPVLYAIVQRASESSRSGEPEVSHPEEGGE